MKKHIPGITGVVLAGGLGRRLGGIDKGLLPVAGRPLIERSLACLIPQVDQVMINANRNAAEYARYGYPVLSDSMGGNPGPLAGMLSAMQAAKTEYVLCVPCDAAWLPPDLANRMLSTLATSGNKVCAVHDGAWLHPVCALIPCSLVADLRQWLANDRREVAGWLQKHGLATVRFADWPSVYWSINTRDDLDSVERRLRSASVQPPSLILEGAA